MADRVAVPSRVDVLGVRGTIQENLTVAVDVALKQNHDQILGLDQLIGVRIAARHTGRQAASFGILNAFVGLTLLEETLGFGLHGKFADVVVFGNIGSVTGIAPQATQVDLAIGGPRCRSRSTSLHAAVALALVLRNRAFRRELPRRNER